MVAHQRLVWAALLLACLPGFAGASEGAGLFSAHKEVAALRPPSRGLLGAAAGGARELALGGVASFAELRSRTAEVDLGQLESARLGVEGHRPARLGLNLFADAAFEAVFERSAPTASGYTLAGRLEDDPLSTVALAVNGEWVAGQVWGAEGRYVIRPLGGGVAEVRQVDPSSQGRCGLGVAPEGFAPPPRRASSNAGSARVGQAPPQASTAADSFSPDDGSEIDLLVAYPSFARRSAGGHLAMRALIDSDVALTNEMYRASGAAQRINLVGAVELRRRPGDEADRNMHDFIDRLLDSSDGHMDEVHDLRDAYAADMVLAHWGHWLGTGRGLTIGGVSGIALLMDDLSGDYERVAFVVANSLAFAHELGHGMGLRHERAYDAGNTPFPYSHGHVVLPGSSPKLPPERGMQTIMAAFGYEPWDIPRFSNPNLRYPDESGVAIGVPGDAPSDSADGPADAVRSLNGTRRVVANFRPSASRCNYKLSPPDSLPASGGDFRIGVKAGSGCPWSAWSSDGHVSVQDGASGVGDGEVVFRVSANEGWERDVAVFVAGEAYLAEQATARERRVPPPVCERIPGVRTAITAAAGKGTCGEVTASDLASIRVLRLWCALACWPPEDERNWNFPIGSLDGLTGLVSLDLSTNEERLTALEPGLFNGLTKLTQLNLSENDLRALRAGVFDGVPNLIRLDLWDNQNLATLEPGAFRGLSNMETLSLGGTGLTMLPAGAFDGLPNLYSLKIGAKSVNCTPNWDCTPVPVPLARAEPGAFRGLSQLRELDVNNSTLTALQPGLFDGLPNLRSLTIAGHDRLTALQPGLFDGLPNLRTLDLAGTSLATLQPGLFDGLPNLRYLGLYGNSLAALQPGLFDGLAELRGLQLQRNKLETLEPGIFRGLAKLEALILYENQLQSLQPEVFDGLPRLWWLWLRDNKLATLHPNLFRRLDGLRQLELDGNQLTTLHPDLFRGLGLLWYVDLSRNRLGTVPPSLFDEQRSRMNTIKLGSNRLASLDPGLFRGMADMNSLQLSDNALATLPPRMFNGLYGLLRMDLTGNPGAPFAFRPELVRAEGASDSGGALGIALELPQGAAFDLRVGLSASGGSLSADEALIRVGRDRSEAVAVRSSRAGPVTVRMVAVTEVPGPPCKEIAYKSLPSHCWKGVQTALGAPLVLHGLPDQVLAADGAVRFDLPSAFPSIGEGASWAVDSSNPATVEATIREGLLIVSAAGGDETTLTVTATDPDGLSAALAFRVTVTTTVEQSIRSRWGGWRSALLRPPSLEGGGEF